MMWLAFDIGTTGTKAAILDGDGRTLQSAYRAYPMRSAEGGIAEQNAVDWWHAVVESAHTLDTSGVEAVALTGQMQDVILIDPDGKPARRVILYSDSRAQQEAEEINQQIGAERLRQLTGNSQDAGGLLAKLRWLTRHELNTLQKSAHLLFGAADFAAFKLTGAAVTDTTTASTTGLLDINTHRLLDTDILAELGMADVVRLLPQVKPGGSLVGTLAANVAEMLGVPPNIPVYHGPGDAGATTLGAGSGEPGTVYGYIGTSGWVAFSSGKRITQETGVFTLAHPQEERYIYVAPLLTAGGNVDWIRAVFGMEDTAALIEEALQCEPTRLLYLPYLNGERSPFTDPFARGAFIGLNPRHSRADLSRAVLEGVIYAYRHALDALIGEPIGGMTLTGGGTRSEAWCQLFADIMGVQVTIADDAENVGVRGAVLAAQVASGQISDYGPSGYFPAARVLSCDGTHREHYDRQYQTFRAAYPALKPIFAEMA